MRRRVGLCLAVAALSFLVYLPALDNGFVSWDDPQVLTENLSIRKLDAEAGRWMLSTFHTGNWIPLTWLSHALVYQAAGLDPRAHHLASVALHGANAALVLLLGLALFDAARRTKQAAPDPAHGLAAATVAALLFALHPLHVESVAWVSERKDVLYAAFYLLGLLAWLGSFANPKEQRLRRRLALLCFLLSLLSKPMAMTFPFLLLVLDLWPLGRLPREARAAVVEKWPLFAIAGVSALVTVAAQSEGGAVAPLEGVPAPFRVMNALRSLVTYLVQALWPSDLLPFYPIGPIEGGTYTAQTLGATLVVCALGALALWKGSGTRGYWSAALASYLVMLAPVLGLVQVGEQLHADRYTYLPLVGPFLLAGALLASRPALLGAAALALAACTLLTRDQIATWKDSVTLWERVVNSHPGASATAHTNLGNAYRAAGRVEDAVRQHQESAKLRPEHPFVHDGLGTALLDLGRVDEAIAAFERAIALEPRYPQALRNLWFAWSAKGRPAEAQAAVEKAVALDPNYADAWSSLGISHARAGRLADAEAAFRRAAQLDPRNAAFLGNLATALLQQGRVDEAIPLYEDACRRAPGEAVYPANLGRALLRKGRDEDARAALRRAQALGGRVDAATLRSAGLE